MNPQAFSIVSWNVGGLVGKHRKYLVKSWIKSLPSPPMITGLQELKSSSFLTTVAMNTIAPDYPRIISKADAGKGGTTLLYQPSLTLANSGIISHGRAAWAQLQHENSLISVAVIYTPSDSSRARALLWHKLKGELPNGDWVIVGDFNLTESPLDSSGPSPLLSGCQLEAWWLLKTHLDLVDAFYLPHQFVGTPFTCRAIHGTCMDQLRLD